LGYVYIVFHHKLAGLFQKFKNPKFKNSKIQKSKKSIFFESPKSKKFFFSYYELKKSKDTLMFLGDNLEKKTIHPNEKIGQVQNMFCDFRGKK
jgi:hypothetical protein